MRARLAQVMTGLAVIALALAIFIGGLGFLVAALYLALAAVLPAAAAAALTGVAALCLAAILLLVCRAVMAPRKQPATGGASPGTQGDGDIGKAISGEMLSLVRQHFALSAGAVFAAGLLLGISPRARQSLLDLIKRQLR